MPPAIITFPQALPDSMPVTGLSFYPDPMVEVTPLRSGEIISADLGPTLWRGHWQAEVLDEDALDDIRAFYDSGTSIEAFYGYDKSKEYPKFYKRTGFTGLFVGASPFTGNCTLSSVETNNVQANLTALPHGFVFSKGDYLAFNYGTRRALHRIQAAQTASGAGAVTVEVRPHIRAGWNVDAPTPTTVQLYRPAAKMIVLPGTYSENIAGNGIGSVNFDAIQVL